MPNRTFSTSAALQDYLLQEAGPGTLMVVSHQRLAHQVWHRQRLTCLEAGQAAWEPVPLITLESWWTDLFRALWPPVSLAPPLQRLAFWGQALKAAPPLEGAQPDLKWAQALDDAYNLLCRHSLPTTAADAADSPLVAWRRQVTKNFQDILRQERLITPGELPAFLWRALNEGEITLPKKMLLAGFQTPAPAEAAWFEALAARTEVVALQVKGPPQAVHAAVELPDRRQEVEWVAAQVVAAACEDGLPWHRLAVTSLALDSYAPQLPGVLAELLGPPQTARGWAYNFSQGPHLAATPLFAAAMLPLNFLALGESRQDLVSLLLSPYYGSLRVHQGQGAVWDRLFRDHRLEQGWERFRQAVAHDQSLPPEREKLLGRLDQIWATLPKTAAPGAQWAAGLKAAWEALEFPADLDDPEKGAWGQLTALTQELGEALASEPLAPREFLEWLTHGAGGRLLPGPGVQSAGLQVLGLLEMRGLDFSRVWCLGMNSGVMPPRPRPLPLLNAAEKGWVLGGTYQSQHRFARELYDTFLGSAPEIILTRPRVEDQEENVATSLYEQKWRVEDMAPLSRPNRAWLRAPAVQATLTIAPHPRPVAEAAAPIAIPLPAELSLTQAQTALACPCRFLLEILLNIKELAEVEAGLDPRERGDLLHKVLARFTAEFNQILDQEKVWDHVQAQEWLRAAARKILAPVLDDLHWQAEWERWLGQETESPGLLWEWLKKEQERFVQGWRWLGLEVRFRDLQEPGWPFSLKGRLDRLDFHEESEHLIIWDYKSGAIPGVKKVFADREEHQLPGYLLAVKRGCVKLPQTPAQVRAGFIGLKSSREGHLKYEDFGSRADQWDGVVAAWVERLKALGQRLAAGDFSPDPTPAPEGRQPGACGYCPYLLVCGFSTAAVRQEETEAEEED
jgi:RecB family exonuclease